MSGTLHPVSGLPGVLQNVSFIKDTALGGLAVPWPRCQDLTNSATGVPYKDDLVLAVSHAWPYQVHPDPLGQKAPYIQELSAQAASGHKPRGNTLLFFDLLSVPQRPFAVGQAQRTKAEDEKFAIGLKAFPQIYLMADATIHLDIPLSSVEGDGEAYSVPLPELDKASVQAVGPSLQVLDAELPLAEDPSPVPFDFVEKVCGTPVDSMQALKEAREAGRTPKQSSFFWCSAAAEPTAQLRKAPFGKRNLLSANVKGWIYLERFASMVKVAMTHESQIEGLVLSNSQEVREQIFEGGARLRAAAANGGGEVLKKVLRSFAEELNAMQFAAVSIDKQKNTGGQGGLDDAGSSALARSDRDVVWGLMQEMVDYLVENWASEQKAQEHRQLQLAVSRQDVEGLSKLLGAGADPNMQDAQGWTVLHEAAKIKNLEIIRVLLEHGADCQRLDKQGSMPAHRVLLLLEKTTIPAFQILTPSRKELEHRNTAGVSPLERFAQWARTASDGAPYQPAQEVVDNLVRTYPGVLKDEASDEASDDEEASKDIVEKLERYEVGGREVAVRTWEHKDGARHHVLYLYFGPFLPPETDEEGVRAIAPKVCGRYSVRLHRLDFYALASSEYSAEVSNEDVMARLCEIIEELPLNPQFVLCENSCGMSTPMLWKLRHRLAGALVLNFGYYFKEDFEDSEDQKKLGIMFTARIEEITGRLADKYLSMTSGPLTYSSCAEKLEPIKRRLAETYAGVPQEFWDWNMHCIRTLTLPQTQFFRRCPPLQPMPMRVTCGAQAPDMLHNESSLRLVHLLPGVETVTYLPKSKCYWQHEGKRQQSKVAELLGSVVSEAFGSEPVKPGPSPAAPQLKQMAETEPPPTAPKSKQTEPLPTPSQTRQRPAAKTSQQPCCSLQ